MDEAINDEDLIAISDSIREGNTSGIIDSEGQRISWSINIEKFSH